MTTALPPDGSGRRDNGLPSAEWGALVDLDPRLSESLLDSLAAEGVAAFVEPARDTDSYTRATVLPKRPLDRLWVDPSRADLARGVVTSEVADLTALLAEQEPGATAHGLVRPVPRNSATRVLPPPELPGPPNLPRPADLHGPSDLAGSPDLASPPDPIDPPDPPGPSPLPGPASVLPVLPGPDTVPGTPLPLSDDELFRQIIEGFSLESEDPVPRWPVSEDLDPPRPPRPTGSTDRPPHRPYTEGAPRRRRSDPRADAPDPVEPLPSWVEPEALADEGHFEPPPAPRVPRLRLRTGIALLTLLLGLLVLFAPFQIGLDDSGISTVLGLLLTGGGAGLLVAWMRDAPRDSGPDDGAVV